MAITLETLKNDEANLVNQLNQALVNLGQIQGALAYNRQKQQEEEKPADEDDPPTEPNVPIK